MKDASHQRDEQRRHRRPERSKRPTNLLLAGVWCLALACDGNTPTPDASVIPDTGGPPPDASVTPDALVTRCGDGVLDPGETCDDGNIVDGDACTSDCTVASCLVPVTHPTIAAGLADAACPEVYIFSGTYNEGVLAIARDVQLIGVGAEPVLARGVSFTIDVPDLTIALRDFIIDGPAIKSNGGGIRASAFVDLSLYGMTIRDGLTDGRLADVRGGGINGSAGGNLLLDNTIIENNQVRADAVDNFYAYGAGIYWLGGTLTVTGMSRISDNQALALQSAPGLGPDIGYSRGGGIYTEDTDVVLQDGTRVLRNQALAGAEEGSVTYGGGIYVWRGSLSILSGSEVSDNQINGWDGCAGGVYANAPAIVDGQSHIDNNTIHPMNGGATPGTLAGGGACFFDHTIIAGGSSVSGNAINGVHVGLASGGGVLINGDIEISQSTISGNQIVLNNNAALTPSARGGGIYQVPFNAMTVSQSTVANNIARVLDGPAPMASSRGGGINAQSNVTLTDSTLSNNLAESPLEARGGGVYINNGTDSLNLLDAVNSTVSGNTAISAAGTAEGGGLYLRSPATVPLVSLNNLTVAYNSADAGGGLYVATSATVHDTVLAENTGQTGPDCQIDPGAILSSGGYNLASTELDCPMVGDVASHIVGVPAGLLPLGNNGGPTETHGLSMASPAVDAGDPAGCTGPTGTVLTTDQRGMPRPAGARCDIGAFER